MILENDVQLVTCYNKMTVILEIIEAGDRYGSVH